MQVVDAQDFEGSRPWEAVDLVRFGSPGPGVGVRLHWTDRPYVWHVNDGPEVFVVLDGAVDMHVRRADGSEVVERLVPGRICVVEPGDEHVAHPDPVARILVVECEGSV